MTERLHIAVVGGGAAGFFAAIAAKQTNPEARVTIFERGQKVLAKVLITGGGRCNLTNSFAQITDLKQAYPRGDKMMKRLFNVFSRKDTWQWFEQRGVKLVKQDDECVFPVSQSAQSVVDALTHEAHKLGVEVRTGYAVEAVKQMGNGDIQLLFKVQKPVTVQRAAITTGGSPQANALQYLANLGHNIVQPVPSLFTFNIADATFKALMGTVVEGVTVSLVGTKHKATGPLLVTHWGASGPAILKLSSYGARYVHDCGYQFPIAVNWIRLTNSALVAEHLQGIVDSNPRKLLTSVHPFGLPTRMWQYILEKTALGADKRWDELGKKGLNKLVEALTNDQYKVTGKGAFRDEFVTCGGVSLSDINLNTMESKVCKNLYFAGEVLDVDAITGGFNLQAAWTTGYVAGKAMAL
ncbi:MAG: NAD(P)/FAD-dependent oxidoreductase [Prevotella shahii]|jgi:flavoprotein family protein|uniref:NAD(P)/FAD-dependent oxidoreductase n=1 Tax=Hoylesella shahii TaxID=228603 RepID=UPI001CB590CC|nr:NAD(P)/FAD-dependent oxidoreductase [Hoylesella shahii]MBF1568105.1 NAD(P)/FAD-dependent oxidoreductase [Hoylesella shahii]